ncbi:surface-anchored protein [Lentzea atacamensis]|uniref:Surface-anchored protein n=2 Tax=Lentzea TaxID=165301 RepID=A0A316I8J6_9PSEU|nr:choice-of-anchor M domain-containing protein [Lentzea atacamensis]PWK83599.1 surface-anchored protein [Lentzea atacamensis]RAS67348.1 surface-anchored protein [Lentzea atacamensis]
MRTRARLALLPLAAAMLIGGAGPATAATTITLDSGHVDVIGIAFEDNQFHVHVHDEGTDTEYEPSQVRFAVKPAARTEVPNDPAYAFLGAPGKPVWVLPQVEDPQLLWPGIASEEVQSGVFANDSLTVKIECVSGPADFSIFTTDPVGAPTVLVDSGNGLPDSVTLPAASHLHANWAFEAAGNYAITVRVSGTLAATGKKVTSAPATYRFKVIA